jgi:histidine triad (HIT) family protein
MNSECIFCKIISGQISANKVYEDDFVFAFMDINPQAPVHIIIIPKKHIESLAKVSSEDKNLLGHIQLAAANIAGKYTEMKDGFRLINNCGKNAGQTVFHLHYHLLGGRELGWTPG